MQRAFNSVYDGKRKKEVLGDHLNRMFSYVTRAVTTIYEEQRLLIKQNE